MMMQSSSSQDIIDRVGKKRFSQGVTTGLGKERGQLREQRMREEVKGVTKSGRNNQWREKFCQNNKAHARKMDDGSPQSGVRNVNLEHAKVRNVSLSATSVADEVCSTESSAKEGLDVKMGLSDDSMNLVMQYMEDGKPQAGSGSWLNNKGCDIGPSSRPANPEAGYELRARYLEQQAATLSAQDGILEGKQPVQACLAKTSFVRAKLPRAYAWIRTATGAARRVTILFDSGASQCFVHPRVFADLEIVPDTTAGPNNLRQQSCLPGHSRRIADFGGTV